MRHVGLLARAIAVVVVVVQPVELGAAAPYWTAEPCGQAHLLLRRRRNLVPTSAANGRGPGSRAQIRTRHAWRWMLLIIEPRACYTSRPWRAIEEMRRNVCMRACPNSSLTFPTPQSSSRACAGGEVWCVSLASGLWVGVRGRGSLLQARVPLRVAPRSARGCRDHWPRSPTVPAVSAARTAPCGEKARTKTRSIRWATSSLARCQPWKGTLWILRSSLLSRAQPLRPRNPSPWSTCSGVGFWVAVGTPRSG